jgi:hypothetical protein
MTDNSDFDSIIRFRGFLNVRTYPDGRQEQNKTIRTGITVQAVSTSELP